MSALVQAIRAFTVEGQNGEPNGAVERAIDGMCALLDPRTWPADLSAEATAARLAQINDYMADLTSALANNVRALRIAADAYFGGDFTKPEARAARPDDGLEAVFADIREQVAALRVLYPDHDDLSLALVLLRRATAYENAREGLLLGLVGTVLYYAARREAAS